MKLKAISILLSLVCISFVGCSQPSSGSNPVNKTTVDSSVAQESEKTSSEESKKEDTIALVGETLDYDGLKLTLDSVENYVDETKYPMDKAGEGNVFVILNLTAQNDTDADVYLNMFYEDSYCDDTSIDPRPLMVNVEGDSLWGDVSVGKKRKGYVCYEVPQDWQSLEFYYSPEVFKGDVKMKFRVLATDIKA